jgi:hypothetical protein
MVACGLVVADVRIDIPQTWSAYLSAPFVNSTIVPSNGGVNVTGNWTINNGSWASSGFRCHGTAGGSDFPMFLKRRPSGTSIPEITDETRSILHRVGLGLVVFGLLDIGVMIYCIANGLGYSSSFNIFAVISGVYVWRGHPWYVKWVTRAAGFYAAAFCTMVPIAPFLFPVHLGVLELRLHLVNAIVITMATIGAVVFQLRQTPLVRSGLRPCAALGCPSGLVSCLSF